jgi:rod shape-determining protein MreC
VKQRAGAAPWYASPMRALAQRFTLLLLVCVAFVVLVIGKADTILVERVRSVFIDVVTPVLDVVSWPVAGTTQLVEEVRSLADLHGENAWLREERERLMQWQLVAQQLDMENQSLRTLLKLTPNPELDFLSARVVGDYGGTFVHSLLVVAGAREGVKKGQAVITGDGLVGRVIEVGERSARILLITDINSRIPVIVQRTGDRAILAGDNSDYPSLLYLSPDAVVLPGDQIVTSGHGGVFIPGLPAGRVHAVKDGIVEVEPYVEWDRIEYVRLLDYELPGILLQQPDYAQMERAP